MEPRFLVGTGGGRAGPLAARAGDEVAASMMAGSRVVPQDQT